MMFQLNKSAQCNESSREAITLKTVAAHTHTYTQLVPTLVSGTELIASAEYTELQHSYAIGRKL